MKTFVRSLCLLIAPFLLGACHVVTTPRPVGDTPVKMVKTEWDGTWLATGDGEDQSVFQIHVTDEAKGYSAMGAMEFKDERYTVQQMSLHLRSLATKKCGTLKLLNVLDQESGRWYPVVLDRKGDTMTLRWMCPVKLRELAKAGKLPALPEPPAPSSTTSATALMPALRADLSVHADEAFTAALEKFIVENGPDACVNSDKEDTISAERLIKE